MLVEQTIKDDETMSTLSETTAKDQNEMAQASCLTTALCKGVECEYGFWLAPRENKAGVECGAPPGMCSTNPITESKGSHRGHECMSASEDTMHTWPTRVPEETRFCNKVFHSHKFAPHCFVFTGAGAAHA